MMYRVTRVFLLCAMLCGLGACGALNAGDEFRCGERMASNGAVRVCNGLHEVCVCSTRSCAVRLEPTDTQCNQEDGGGYKYLDVPFAHKDVAGTCVAEPHQDSIINASATSTPLCEAEVELDAAPTDAPTDAPAAR